MKKERKMADILFKTENSRIYAENENGKVVAEVTFPEKDGVATIDHTFVDESLRGQGVAGKLVKAAADKIISDGNKIAATCSYAVSWLEKHSEYQTVDAGQGAACRIDGRR